MSDDFIFKYRSKSWCSRDEKGHELAACSIPPQSFSRRFTQSFITLPFQLLLVFQITYLVPPAPIPVIKQASPSPSIPKSREPLHIHHANIPRCYPDQHFG